MNQASIENALRAMLMGDAALLALGVTGAWDGQAPQGSALPYIIMSFMGLPDLWAHDGVQQEGCQVVIKAITEGHSTVTGSAIDGRIQALINGNRIVVDGFIAYLAMRDRPMPRYTENGAGGRIFKHVGGIYRLMSSQI